MTDKNRFAKKSHFLSSSTRSRIILVLLAALAMSIILSWTAALAAPIPPDRGSTNSPQQSADYGDAPESYGTMNAYHTLSSIYLGECVDGEPEGHPCLWGDAADGDDTTFYGAGPGSCEQQGDDEDGVSNFSTLTPGGEASVTVHGGPNGGWLNAWIDFNGNGVFDHPDEHLWEGTSTRVDPVPENELYFNVPPGAKPGPTYARFRLSGSGAPLPPTEPAGPGEVEDYRVQIEGSSPGNIIVEKQTDPDGSLQTFWFDSDYGSGSFTLVDGGRNDSGSLDPGPYSVIEVDIPAGWFLTSATCSDGSKPGAIDLGAGETVTCTFYNTNIQDLDWGDAPDPQYCTLAASNGANHLVVSGAPFLGLGDPTDDPDTETNGQPHSAALGDDIVGKDPDDEDGVLIPLLQTGQPAAITFEVHNGPAFVDGWIDFNGNGVWGDVPGEYVVSGVYATGVYTTDGVSAPVVNVPPDAVSGPTFARFRINTNGSLAPCGGPAENGEVEDYVVEIEKSSGVIIVEKQTDPGGSPQVFDFNPSYGSNFTLVDGGRNDSGSLDPGTYSVSEVNIPTGWELTSATCSDGSNPGAIDLEAGETVTCTFENTAIPILSIDKECTPDITHSPDGVVNCIITYRNAGSAAATNASIVDDYDENHGVVSNEMTNADFNSVSVSVVDGVITWDGGVTIPVMVTSDTVAYSYTLNTAGDFDHGETAVQNEVTLDSDMTEPVSDTETILVEAYANLTIDKVCDPSAGVSPSETVTCTITYQNAGDANATDVTIVDDYDQDYGLVSSIGGSAHFAIGADNRDAITWNGTASILVGASGTLEYDYDLAGQDVFSQGVNYITNTVTIDSAQTEPLSDTETIWVAFDFDADGVDNGVEDGGPNGGDGNDDGVPDSEQLNVASLPNAGDGEYVTLESPSGTELVGVQAGESPSPEDMPKGAKFPWGFFAFTVEGVGVDGTVVVTITLHSTPPEPTVYWKYGPTPGNPTPHWYDFWYDGRTGAEFDSDKVILHFVDGERGDHDLKVNGQIIDPGTAGIVPVGGVTEPFNLLALLQLQRPEPFDKLRTALAAGWLLLAALVATGAVAALALERRAA